MQCWAGGGGGGVAKYTLFNDFPQSAASLWSEKLVIDEDYPLKAQISLLQSSLGLDPYVDGAALCHSGKWNTQF